MEDNILDKKIKQAFKQEIKKPYEYEDIIKNTLNKVNKNENFNNIKVLKKVVCFLLVVILGGSIVFSKDISAFINYLLRNDSTKGVQEAIDNGYIQEVDMKYIDSNGTKVKVTEILMDDYNLSMIFNIEIPEIEDIDNIYNVNLSNFVIKDENNNIIVLELEDSNKYKEFYKQNNIEETSKNIAYNNGAYYGEIVTKYNKNIEYKYTTYSDSFPKSKKLIINFDKIILDNKNSYEKIVIEGNWNLEVNLSEEMYNRETMIYSAKNYSKEGILITSAKVSNTGMKIELITRWGEPVYKESDSSEEKERKTEEFFNNTHSVKDILIKNAYVENSNGERFYTVVNSSDANGGYNQMLNGMLRYWQTFNLTKYNATDTLKLVLEKQGEIIEIELENKNISLKEK